MDYIIDPMWIYWANVVGNLRTVAVIMVIVSVFALIICVGALIDGDCDNTDEDYIFLKKAIITVMCFVVFNALLIVFIPTKDTIVEMIAAKLATKHNVSLGVKELKELITFIADAFKRK